jgi:hypothetical protein
MLTEAGVASGVCLDGCRMTKASYTVAVEVGLVGDERRSLSEVNLSRRLGGLTLLGDSVLTAGIAAAIARAPKEVALFHFTRPVSMISTSKANSGTAKGGMVKVGGTVAVYVRVTTDVTFDVWVAVSLSVTVFVTYAMAVDFATLHKPGVAVVGTAVSPMLMYTVEVTRIKSVTMVVAGGWRLASSTKRVL